MTKIKAQISNECQMTNAKKIYVHPLIQTQPTLVKMHNGKKSKFSIDSGCAKKNPPQSPFAKGGSSRNARTY